MTTPELLALIPRHTALEYRAIPLERDERSLTVALVDPQNLKTQDELRFMTGLKIVVKAITEAEFLELLNAHYPTPEFSYEEVMAEFDEDEIDGVDRVEPPEVAPALERHQRLPRSFTRQGLRQAEEDARLRLTPASGLDMDDAPVVKLVNLILIDAIKKRARRILLQCDQRCCEVSYEIDGRTFAMMKPPLQLWQTMIRRLAVIAGLDPFAFNRLQAGYFSLLLGRGRRMNYRVAIILGQAHLQAVVNLYEEPFEALPDVDAHQEKRSPALEEKLLEAPEDPSGYQVYADWLIEQGDPRGELASQQLSEPTEVLSAKDKARFLGAFHEHPDILSATWYGGFIQQARLFVPVDPAGACEEALLESLLAQPSARFLQRLELVLRHDPQDYERSLAKLAELAPPTLRSLTIGAGEASRLYGLSGSMAQLNGLKGLRCLEVHARTVELGGLERDRLETLRLYLGGADNPLLNTLAREPWTALESLELWFGASSVSLLALERALAPRFWPRLKTLSLFELPEARWARALRALPLCDQLRTARFSDGKEEPG